MTMAVLRAYVNKPRCDNIMFGPRFANAQGSHSDVSCEGEWVTDARQDRDERGPLTKIFIYMTYFPLN